MWLTPLLPLQCVQRKYARVIMWMLQPHSVCMHDSASVSDICARLEYVWVDVTDVRPEDGRVAVGCCRGWMDQCEHLFNAPFTATGLIHLSEMPLSFRLSDVHSNHSHWWITPSPLASITLSVWCRVVISENAAPAARVGAWEPRQCVNVHLSTRVDMQLLLQLCSSLRQVVFFKNKCRKTSAEMWPHAALAHHKWFLAAGGCRLAPVTCCFLQQTTS